MLDITHLDHVGIAVNSIDRALEFYKLLGVKNFYIKQVPSEMVKVCMLELDNIKLELIEPTSLDSPVSKFLKKNGEGLHQICFKVSDLAKTIKMLQKNDIKLVDGYPRDGVSQKIAFIHPKSAHGVLVELVES